ncbi:MAG TPA: two-component system response regulator [candidate division Zixibacteria bacterium]|jgi:CheY-like chemotaxis protein|nr:two-component system response regulator [candidate division Zixibacteria bacterium]
MQNQEGTEMKKILVADDEANIRLFFDELLSDSGYQVTAVGTGREALRKLLKERYDLLVADVKMPDLNGLELLERIRELGNGIPVIICTSFKHLQEDYVVNTSGVSAYVTKPVNVEDFRNKVREILEAEPAARS